MQAKEILSMPAIINMEIMSAQIELEHYKRLAVKMEKCFVENEETQKKREELNNIIINYKRTITEKYLCRVDAEQRICNLVAKLSDERIKTALKYRYICLMNFDEIAEKMSYCTRQVRRFLEKGTEQLQEVVQENSE